MPLLLLLLIIIVIVIVVDLKHHMFVGYLPCKYAKIANNYALSGRAM